MSGLWPQPGDKCYVDPLPTESGQLGKPVRGQVVRGIGDKRTGVLGYLVLSLECPASTDLPHGAEGHVHMVFELVEHHRLARV